MTSLVAGRIAGEDGVREGWIEIANGRVVARGDGDPARPADGRADGLIAPGLCDLQVNGAGGREVSGDEAALDAIDAVQVAHGVTSYLPALISPDDETAERILPALERRAADSDSPVAGVHVEGPFISPEHAGMHPPGRLRTPAEGAPAWLSSPAIRIVTLAPELPGALGLIEALSARGVVVSLGHSGADADTARAAIDAGASAVTHVFNAMGPLDHRAPGLAGVALVDERLSVAVIADGVHVAPEALELVRRAAAGRVALVTDSTPGAGAGADRYEMAGVEIAVGEGPGGRTRDGRLAGSKLTLDAALRGWTELTEATLADAIAAAAVAPAELAGLPHARVGDPADLVELDERGEVRRVMRGGRWLS